MPSSAAADAAPRTATPPAPAASDPQRRDLRMEGHLSAIAFWYRLAGALGLGAVGLLLIGGFFVNDTNGLVLAFLSIFWASFGGVFALGRQLNRYSNGARIIAGVLGAISLAFNVLSTLGIVVQAARGVAPNWLALFSSANLALGSLWSGANLWALFNQRAATICAPEYRALIARPPMEKPHTYSSPFFWLPLVWTGLCLVGSIFVFQLMASLAATLSQ